MFLLILSDCRQVSALRHTTYCLIIRKLGYNLNVVTRDFFENRLHES